MNSLLRAKALIITAVLVPAVFTHFSAVRSVQDGGSLSQVVLPPSTILELSNVRLLEDIDEQNMAFAKRNILQNNLQSRIRPLLTKPHDPLIPLDAFKLERSVVSFGGIL